MNELARAAEPTRDAPSANAEATFTELGRRIYDEGLAVDGAVLPADIGSGGPPLQQAMACAGCHGVDGLGRSEGGLVAPNITWRNLSKPYEVRGPTGQQRPGYNPALLARAVRDGVDAAGRALDSRMPRFRLGTLELQAVQEHLQALPERATVPGVTPTHILVALAPPADGRAMAWHARLAKAIQQQMTSLLPAAGIHGRVWQWVDDPASALLVIHPVWDSAAAPSLRRGQIHLLGLRAGAGDGLLAGRDIFAMFPDRVQRADLALRRVAQESVAAIQFVGGQHLPASAVQRLRDMAVQVLGQERWMEGDGLPQALALDSPSAARPEFVRLWAGRGADGAKECEVQGWQGVLIVLDPIRHVDAPACRADLRVATPQIEWLAAHGPDATVIGQRMEGWMAGWLAELLVEAVAASGRQLSADLLRTALERIRLKSSTGRLVGFGSQSHTLLSVVEWTAPQ